MCIYVHVLPNALTMIKQKTHKANVEKWKAHFSENKRNGILYLPYTFYYSSISTPSLTDLHTSLNATHTTTSIINQKRSPPPHN